MCMRNGYETISLSDVFMGHMQIVHSHSKSPTIYPGTTSFRPPKKYFVLFYLLSSPVVLVIALYYLSVQEQQI